MVQGNAASERIGEEKDKQIAEMKEENLNYKNSVKENELTSRHLQADTARLAEDLKEAKKQLETKETDMRDSNASMRDERLLARSDKAALQKLIQDLQDDRAETAGNY